MSITTENTFETAIVQSLIEKGGYTLTDRGTWIKYMDQKGADNKMKIIVENERAKVI